MKPMSVIKKVIGAAMLAVIVIVLAATVIVRVLKKDEKKPFFLFGRAFLWVETASMDPAIEARSFILVKRYDGEELKDGEVITFVCTDVNSEACGQLITHRIVEKIENGYKTKGDNPSAVTDPWTVAAEDVVAVYEKNLKVMTCMGRIFASKVGLAIIIATFLFSSAFIIFPDVLAAFKEDNSKQKEKIIADRVEREVERMLKENGSKNDEK